MVQHVFPKTRKLETDWLIPYDYPAMIDLHTHSSASDGSLGPGTLIEEAVKRKISSLALTDHDTITGLPEAEKAALERGIHFIPGVEFEIIWKQEKRAVPETPEIKDLSRRKKTSVLNAPAGEFHLLGLGIRQPSPGLKEAIEDMTRRRQGRNLEIVEKMNQAGIDVSYDEIKALAYSNAEEADRASIGRPHFADYLVKKKIVRNRDQAFMRFLGKGKPFYAPKVGLEFEQAVKLIKESGGIAILAHPMSLYTAWGRLPALIKNLKERGLDGLEAWHPATKVSSCKRLEELGKKLDLYITAGSDFHGAVRPDRKLGITAGGKKIDESYLEAIPGLLC